MELVSFQEYQTGKHQSRIPMIFLEWLVLFLVYTYQKEKETIGVLRIPQC